MERSEKMMKLKLIELMPLTRVRIDVLIAKWIFKIMLCRAVIG